MGFRGALVKARKHMAEHGWNVSQEFRDDLLAMLIKRVSDKDNPPTNRDLISITKTVAMINQQNIDLERHQQNDLAAIIAELAAQYGVTGLDDETADGDTAAGVITIDGASGTSGGKDGA